MKTAWFTNCWEGDYRVVLRPEFLAAKLCMYEEKFDHKFVTINNVKDMESAVHLASHCVASGVIDEYLVVREHQDNAFKVLGIDPVEVSRVLHFTNWAAVAITNSDCEYLVHCAADITFEGNRKWVSHAISYMSNDSNIIMVSPTSNNHGELEKRQGVFYSDGVVQHPGITDTCFVLRRADAYGNYYSEIRTVESTFPLHDFGACWEERLDTYIRNHGLYRLILSDVVWIHWGNEGASYPRRTKLERILRRLGIST